MRVHKALLLLARIPEGKVTTYKDLARACGTSPRAIASVLAANRYPNRFPCYKVVMSDGSLGGYSGPGGAEEKERRLHADGVVILNGWVDLERYGHRF